MNEEPYITKTRRITDRYYNPKYGDERICKCGHSYYRHFDSWEIKMDDIGCKYCGCCTFEELEEKDLKK